MIEYAITVYGSTSKKHIEHLQIIQNMLIRSMSPANSSISTISQYKELNILDINKLYELNLGCHMYRVKYGLCPKLNLIQFMSEHTHNTRYKSLVKKPQYIKQISTKSLVWQAPTFWNKIPDHIKSNNNYKRFKSNLKQHILNN